MREAKNVATILGTIAVCLISGLMVADKAAPNVNSSNMVEIEQPASEEMTVAAIQTSVSTTTAIVTTTATTTTVELTTTTAPAETTTTTTAPEIVTEAVQEIVQEELPQEPAAEPEETVEDSEPEEEPAEEETETETPAEPEETETEHEGEAFADTQGAPEENENRLPITDEEFVVLCNVVAHEAGSAWISEYDKALVVEVIMNRVNSSSFPGTITEVLTQRNQFTGSESYAFKGTYLSYVTEQVQNAVRYYFNNQAEFNHGYLYFWGDGRQNHFR